MLYLYLITHLLYILYICSSTPLLTAIGLLLESLGIWSCLVLHRPLHEVMRHNLRDPIDCLFAFVNIELVEFS